MTTNNAPCDNNTSFEDNWPSTWTVWSLLSDWRSVETDGIISCRSRVSKTLMTSSSANVTRLLLRGFAGSTASSFSLTSTGWIESQEMASWLVREGDGVCGGVGGVDRDDSGSWIGWMLVSVVGSSKIRTVSSSRPRVSGVDDTSSQVHNETCSPWQ